MASPGDVNVRVAVRCRPLSGEEKRRGERSVVAVDPQKRQVKLQNGAGSKRIVKAWNFDRVFGTYSTQQDIFEEMALPIVEEVLSGFNCTIFAYGQTGTGKTYTMEGMLDDREDAGVIPRSIRHIFEALDGNKSDYSVRMSFLELYNEELGDLLSEDSSEPKSLRLCDDPKRGVVCQNLEEICVFTPEETFGHLRRGIEHRATAATLCNKNSSRSHSILTLKIMIKEMTNAGEELMRHGQLNLVDLAGSECIGRSGATNNRAREAKNINQSLLTLGRVITALVEHHSHVPYRDSKLTRLLQESLGGRAKTCIIATLSPSHGCIDESGSTLEYAARAKNIKNRPEVNQRMSKRHLVREFSHEIESLKTMLEASRQKNGVYLHPDQFAAMEEQIASQEAQINEAEQALQQRKAEAEQLLGKCTELEEIAEATRIELEEGKRRLKALRAQLHDAMINLRNVSIALSAEKTVSSEAASAEELLYSQAKKAVTQAEQAQKDAIGFSEKVKRFGKDSKRKILASQQLETDVQEKLEKMASSVRSFSSKSSEVLKNIATSHTDFEKLSEQCCSELNEVLVKRFEQLVSDNSALSIHCKSLNEDAEKVNDVAEGTKDAFRALQGELEATISEFQSVVKEQQTKHQHEVAKQVREMESVNSSLRAEHDGLISTLQQFVEEQSARTAELHDGMTMTANDMREHVTAKQAEMQKTADEERARMQSDVEGICQGVMEMLQGFVNKRNAFATSMEETSGALMSYATAQMDTQCQRSKEFSEQATEALLQHKDSAVKAMEVINTHRDTGFQGALASLRLLEEANEGLGEAAQRTCQDISGLASKERDVIAMNSKEAATISTRLRDSGETISTEIEGLSSSAIQESAERQSVAVERLSALSSDFDLILASHTEETEAFSLKADEEEQVVVEVLREQMGQLQQPLESTGETPRKARRSLLCEEDLARCRDHQVIREEALETFEAEAAPVEPLDDEDASTHPEVEEECDLDGEEAADDSPVESKSSSVAADTSVDCSEGSKEISNETAERGSVSAGSEENVPNGNDRAPELVVPAPSGIKKPKTRRTRRKADAQALQDATNV